MSMIEADLERLANEYAHNPGEVQVAMWFFILDIMDSFNEELISFEDANYAVFQAALATGAAMERAAEITKKTH